MCSPPQACQTMRTGSSLGHHPHRRLSQQHSPSHHSHTPVRRSPASSTEHLPSYHTHPNSRRSPVTPAEESTQSTESSQSVVHMRKIPVEPDTLFCYSTVPGRCKQTKGLLEPVTNSHKLFVHKFVVVTKISYCILSLVVILSMCTNS